MSWSKPRQTRTHLRFGLRLMRSIRCVVLLDTCASIPSNLISLAQVVANIFLPRRKESSSHHRPYPLPVAIRRANPPRWWRWTPLHSTLSSPRHICEQKLSLINKSSDISPEQKSTTIHFYVFIGLRLGACANNRSILTTHANPTHLCAQRRIFLATTFQF